MTEQETTNITYFPSTYSIELKEKLKLTSPTSGMIFLYTLYKEQGFLKDEEIYGFTKNTSDKSEGYTHYYEKIRNGFDAHYASSFYTNIIYKGGHSISREVEFRKTLLENSK